MAADKLRFEQFAEAARIQRAAVEDGLAVGRPGAGAPAPAAHELLEIEVADLGAVEALHAGRDRIRNGGEHAVPFSGGTGPPPLRGLSRRESIALSTRAPAPSPRASRRSRAWRAPAPASPAAPDSPTGRSRRRRPPRCRGRGRYRPRRSPGR